MSFIIFGVLALLVSFFVVLPILQARTSRKKELFADSNHKAEGLLERKEAIYSAIKEIEFDYEMGKLSQEDFKELRQQYKEEAVELLKTIDAREISEQKRSKKAAGKPGKTEKANFCWMCGTNLQTNDNYCPNCGNAIGSSK